MLKVLVVDDEELICKGIRSMVTGLGYESIGEIHTAPNAMEALKVFNEINPEIIITDIRMPRMNGLDMIREMQKAGTGAKYIIISGHNDFDYAKEALKLGVVDYLLKPVSTSELKVAIDKIFNGYRSYRY